MAMLKAQLIKKSNPTMVMAMAHSNATAKKTKGIPKAHLIRKVNQKANRKAHLIRKVNLKVMM